MQRNISTWGSANRLEAGLHIRSWIRTIRRPFVLCAAVALLIPTSIDAAGTFWVDTTDPACSDSGPGTSAIPYCSIVAAAGAQGGPGTTILVRPGVYREMVTVPAAGASGDPFVIRAESPGVVIDGSEDLSSPAAWVLHSGSVWIAAGVTWSPGQVIVDDVRLTPSLDPPALLTAGTFRHVTGEGLYVNIGGDNPGAHQTFAGRRINGFRLTGRAWVVIDGFSVTRADQEGIAVRKSSTTPSSDLEILNNSVAF